MTYPLEDRIESKIERVTESGCWIWIGSLDTQGYGQLGWKGTTRLAHRIVYTLTIGSIPVGMFLCHRCDVRSCVNPYHMFVGTRQDNTDDAKAKGRYKWPLKLACKRGHAMPDNAGSQGPQGGRYCKACRRISQSQRVP